LPIGCQRAALLRGILRRENPTYTYWRRAARASRDFKILYSLSRRKTFVGGKCAPQCLSGYCCYRARSTQKTQKNKAKKHQEKQKEKKEKEK